MTLRPVLVALFAAVVMIFALQNTAPTTVRFFFWSFGYVPVSAVIFLALAAGIAGVGVPLWLETRRLRARARTLEARLESIQLGLSKRGEPPRPTAVEP